MCALYGRFKKARAPGALKLSYCAVQGYKISYESKYRPIARGEDDEIG